MRASRIPTSISMGRGWTTPFPPWLRHYSKAIAKSKCTSIAVQNSCHQANNHPYSFSRNISNSSNCSKVNTLSALLYAGPNLTPALITPGKKSGLPPLWVTFNAIQECRILKIDKDIIYALLVTGNLNNC